MKKLASFFLALMLLGLIVTTVFSQTPYQIYLPLVMTEPEPTQPSYPYPIRAKNNVQAVQSNGVTIEIIRVLYAEKNYLENLMDFDFDAVPVMQDKITLVEFVFKITNNNPYSVQLFKDEFMAAFSSEQVDFAAYRWYPNDTWIGPDDFYNEIMPGVTLTDGVWVGLRTTSWDGFTSFILKLPYLFRTDTYETIVPEQYITIDVSGWGFEPLP